MSKIIVDGEELELMEGGPIEGTDTLFTYFDEYPQDSPFKDSLEIDDLAYREKVVEDLLDAAGEYLKFGTFRDLVRLLLDVV